MIPSLFSHIVFGPVHSRRLGASLGINLLPLFEKWCTFDCIYCECGWNKNKQFIDEIETIPISIPSRQDVFHALEEKLIDLTTQKKPLDVITFSGNGEPTLHPNFKAIITDTISLRNQYAPNALVCVLSNSLQLGRPNVFEGLLMADKRILKVDSAIEETIYTINQPSPGFNFKSIVDELSRFHGDFTLQTLFLNGVYNGMDINNTTPAELKAWLELIKELKPKEVMIYTLDRKTPAKELVKVPLAELESISNEIKSLNLSIKVQIAG